MNPENFIQYLQIAAQVVGVASMVATITPTPKDDGVLRIAKSILDIFAMNFGKAKNKE